MNRWLIWNEPNQARWLQPTSPKVYVTKLLNPAYRAIKQANPQARVGGGVTAPRGNLGGVSPLAWIEGMGRAGAKLDAYAHHPYPLQPQVETPWSGGCRHCQTISMASLDRLIAEGLIESRVGSGTFVSEALKSDRPQQPPAADLARPGLQRPRLSRAMDLAFERFSKRQRLPHAPRAFVTALPAFDAFPMAQWARRCRRLVTTS